MKKVLLAIPKHFGVFIFTLASVFGWGQTTIFTETMGTVPGTTAIATHETANGFDNDSYTMSGTGDLRVTSPSLGYTGASGSANVFITNTTNTNFLISNIDTSTYTSLVLTFGELKSGAAGAANLLVVEVSSDGTNFTPLSYTRNDGAVWALISPTGTIPSTSNLRIRFRNPATTQQFRVDDIKLTGVIAGKVSTGTGDWNTASTWSPSGVPTATDNVTILAGHTVHTTSALTRNASTTVNGTFQLNAGGWATGTNFTYGAGATLNFNNTSSYGVNSGDVFWPTSNGPTNVTVLQGGLTLNSGANRTVTGTFQTAAGVTLSSSSLTLSGTCQINNGGFFNNAPTYTNTSTLVYNGVSGYGVNNEWTGNSSNAGTGIPQNVTLTNSSINMPNSNRGLAGNLSIGTGSTLNLNSSSGDLYIAGNWSNSGTFNPNSRAVFFNGTTTQTVTNSSGTETFNYLIVDNSSSLKLATGTNIAVNGNNGLTLSTTHASASIDLNGQTFTLSGGGNLNLNSGNRFINSSVTGGVFKIGANTVSVINPGTLAIGTVANPTFTTMIVENGSYNAGTGAATTIEGILQINSLGYITGNTVKYGTSSTLRYNSGGVYNRNFEWNGTTLTTAPITGIPNNVEITNNTTLNYRNPLNLGNQFIANNLTINAGSSLYMDYGSATCGGYLQIGGNLISAGNLTLGFASGDDLRIAGNITFNTGYTFDAKGRAVIFTKTSATPQVITASSTPTFHYVNLVGTSTVVQLATGTNAIVTAPNTGNVISFANAANTIDINGNTLTLGTTGVANTISGNGKFKGDLETNITSTSSLVLFGNGSIETVNFQHSPTPTSNYAKLNSFTINRQAATIGCVLGTPLIVNTNLALTNGIVDLGGNMLTLGSTAAGAGTLTGGSSSSYIIADKAAGGVFKRFTPTATSYLFPIGDAVSSADGTQFSPATINLTTATLTSGSYLQLNTHDTIAPNNEATVDYITRYWNLNGSSVTAATYNFTGTYLPVDVVGTEANSFSGRYATSSSWTEGANLASNTVSLTGLTTATGVINLTPDSNHYSGGAPLKKAEINIKQGSTNYLTKSTYDFGSVVSGVTKDIVFTIENTGLENLNLSAATITGSPEYTLFSNYTSPVIKGGTTTFTIRFTPSVAGIFTGSISIPNNDTSVDSNSNSENPYIINFTGTSITSSTTDIITNGNEQVVISSLENDASITSTTDGVEVWQFTIRDGGVSSPDADNLPSILTAFNISKTSGNSVGSWSDAIQAIALFDGSTKIANGVVTASQIQFSGLNVNVADNTNKTLTLRLSLKNPLGANAFDGEDFGFSISNANTTFSSSGSGKANFTAASTNDKNIIDVTATELRYTQDATTTVVNDTMTPVIIIATDANGNIDKNYTSSISITSTGTLSSAVSGTFVAGTVTFNSIIHTATATARQLTATSGGLTKTSALFDVVIATTLLPGDLAIVAVNTNGTIGDQIAFVAFKDITPGTKIFITDNGYETRNAGKWGNTEGVLTITRIGSVLPKGTIIVYQSNSTNVTSGSQFDIYTCGIVDNNWSKNITGLGSGFDLNSNDDIWIMQGGSWNHGTVGNVGGLPSQDATYNGNVLYGWTESGWNFGVGDGLSTYPTAQDNLNRTKYSNVLPGLKCFTTTAPDGDGKVKFNIQNYTAMLNNDQLEWIALINETSNWTNYLSNTNYDSSGYNYIGSSTCVPITIIDDAHTNGKWNGTEDVNWFNCSNWDTLKVPDASTNVTFNTSVANNAKIDATAVDSDLYGDIAKANNLTIDKTLTIEASINNKLEVYGNVNINSGGVLDMDDGNAGTQDGQVYLYGNWNNNGTTASFLEGQGTVHLLGTSPQIINSGNHTKPETFGNLVLGNNYDTKPSNDLILTGNLTINNNATPFSLIINDSDNFVEVGGNIVTNNGTITVENDGGLIQRGNTYTGTDLTLKRNALLKRLDYNYWGSPVSGQVLKQFSLGTLASRFYTYNESTDGFEWIDPYANTFSRGKAYAIRASNSYTSTNTIFNGVFKGQPNTGTFSYNLNYTDATRGYNLVSNPYPSNIDLDLLYTLNSGNITGAFYFWTNINPNPAMQYENYPNGGYYNNYAIYNASGGVPATAPAICVDACVANSPTPNNIVKPGQGFMVRSLGAGKILDFNNTIRTAAKNGIFFNTKLNSNEADRFWLQLTTPLDVVSTILVAYKKGATNDLDTAYDAKLFITGEDSFYSKLNEDKLAIQGRNYPLDTKDVVDLGTSYYKDGNYTISIAKKEGIFNKTQTIYLVDNLLKKIVNLSEQSYTFQAVKGKDENRFHVVYQPIYKDILSVDNEKDKEVQIYENETHFVVNSQNKNMKQVIVYDASGRLILDKKPNKKQILLEKSEIILGNYIFSIIFDDEIINKKVIKKH